jgi:hypothetical protein
MEANRKSTSYGAGTQAARNPVRNYSPEDIDRRIEWSEQTDQQDHFEYWTAYKAAQR